MRCTNVALTYKDNPKFIGGRELDQMIPCTKEGTTQRDTSRRSQPEKLSWFCDEHAAHLDAFRAWLHEQTVKAFRSRCEHFDGCGAYSDGPCTCEVGETPRVVRR